MTDRVRYLTAHEVDRSKWDACVVNAQNSMIFGTGIYLDMMADNWNAIVIDDYKAVMPLPWRKNYFIPYYYRVPFIPQGGIFGELDESMMPYLKKAIFTKIRFGDILLNHGNRNLAVRLHAHPVTKMVLDLQQSYYDIQAKYNREVSNRLKKAAKLDLSYVVENNIVEAITLFRKHNKSNLRPVREIDFERFRSLCIYLQKHNKAFSRKITDSKGRIIAIGLFLIDENRIYNMMNTVLRGFRGKWANYFLYDQLIHEFAGRGLTLDFEGSEVPSIRKFYEQFGSINEPCYWFRKIF